MATREPPNDCTGERSLPRLSPISRTVSEYVTGRDDRGIKRESAEQFSDFLSWFKPIHCYQKLVERLLALVISSKMYSRTPTANGV